MTPPSYESPVSAITETIFHRFAGISLLAIEEILKSTRAISVKSTIALSLSLSLLCTRRDVHSPFRTKRGFPDCTTEPGSFLRGAPSIVVEPNGTADYRLREAFINNRHDATTSRLRLIRNHAILKLRGIVAEVMRVHGCLITCSRLIFRISTAVLSDNRRAWVYSVACEPSVRDTAYKPHRLFLLSRFTIRP